MIIVKGATQNRIILVFIVSCFVLLAGIFVFMSRLDTSQNKPAVVEGKLFTDSEETAFMLTYTESVSKSASPAVVEDLARKNIARLSRQGANNVLSGYVYILINETDTMNRKIEALQSAFSEADAEDMDFNDSKAIAKITDETLKGFLRDVSILHFVIEKYDGFYYVKPDFGYVVNTYGNFVDEDLRGAIQLVTRESRSALFNSETSLFNFDIIVEKILVAEALISKFPNTRYLPQILGEKSEYYKMYFGTTTAFNVYLTDNNGKMLDEVLSEYKRTISTHPDSQLAKDLQTYLSMLEKTKYVQTDDIKVWLLTLTEVKTEDTSVDGVVTP